MNYAFIKNNVCFNVAVFDSTEQVHAFKEAMMIDNFVDDIVKLKEGFGVGDGYTDGVWTKQEVIEPVHVPSIEERLTIAEDTLNFLLRL